MDVTVHRLSESWRSGWEAYTDAVPEAALAHADRRLSVNSRNLGHQDCRGRSLPPLLRRCDFVRLPGNVHFFVRDPAGDRALPQALADWWLTRGDSDAEEVF